MAYLNGKKVLFPVQVHSGGGEIADGSITTAKLADEAVTTAKLANDVFSTIKALINEFKSTPIVTGHFAVSIIQLLNSAFSFTVNPTTGYEGVCFSLGNYGLENGKTYELNFKFRTSITSFHNSYPFGFVLNKNNTETQYTAQFTSEGFGYLTFYLGDATASGSCYISDFELTEITE